LRSTVFERILAQRSSEPFANVGKPAPVASISTANIALLGITIRSAVLQLQQASKVDASEGFVSLAIIYVPLSFFVA
jgi:hypothetical protein